MKEFRLELRPFKLKNKKYWNRIVDSFKNHNKLVKEKKVQEGFGKAYYCAIIEYASKLAYLSEKMIEYGYMKNNKIIFEVARKYAFYDMIDKYEISNNQAAIAKMYLKECWEYGGLL